MLTRKTRVEIHNSLATLILVHTSRPTSNDREIVCRRLIEKYPSLRDSFPSGYVSIFVRFLYIILLLFKVFLQLLYTFPLNNHAKLYMTPLFIIGFMQRDALHKI